MLKHDAPGDRHGAAHDEALRAKREFRILHLITRLDRGGSAENTLLTVAGLAPPFRPTLLAGRTREPSPLLARLADTVEVEMVPELVRPISPGRDLVALYRIYRRLRRERVDLVHTHSSKAGILGRVAARWAGVPRLVHTPHGHVFTGYAGPAVTGLYVRLERWAARFTDRIVGLTDREAQDHLARGIGRPDQFVTIPSGVPLAAFEAPAVPPERVKAALGLPPDARVIGSVGRLEPIKGHRVLVEAFQQLAPRAPDVALVLAGDGELAAPLRAACNRAGLAGRVRFLGWRTDVPDLLHAFDVFVLPSLNEGMGRALVEAMAAGRPIVASRAGGIPEVLGDDEAGILVQPGEARALAAAIETCLAEPDLGARLGKAARERARRYSVEAMVEKLEALYRELLTPGGR